MTSLPQILHRTVDSEEARRNHLLGILWFRSLKRFRMQEGAGRDEMEGLGSYTVRGEQHGDIADDKPIFPAFIQCFSEKPLPKYGNFGLKLLDPCALRKRVECRFPKGTTVEWLKVTYDKTEHLDAVPNPYEERHRKHYGKPACFAREREWRLVIFLSPPLRLLNDTLKPCVATFRASLGTSGETIIETKGLKGEAEALEQVAMKADVVAEAGGRGRRHPGLVEPH